MISFVNAGKQKIISILLCFLILLSCIPVKATGAEEIIQNEPDFYSDGGITVKLNESEEKSAVIAAAVYDSTGKMVAFDSKYCTGGNSVKLETGKAYSYKLFAFDDNFVPVTDAKILKNPDAYVEFHGEATLPALSGGVSSATSMLLGDFVSATGLMQEIYDLVGDEESISAFISAGSADMVDNRIDNEHYETQLARQKEYDDACKLIDNAIEAWDRVITSGAVADKIVSEENQKLDSEIKFLSSINMDYSTKSEQLEWAQKITESFDAKKGNNRIAQLAEDMGCDAKHAYTALTIAQGVLQGKYAGEEEALAEKWIRIMTATKTASKVGLFVCATLATGGTATAAAPVGYVTTGEAVGIAISGVDCALEVSTTTAKIILGDEHASVKAYEGMLEPITEVLSIYGLVTGGDGSLGEKIAYYGDIAEKLGVYEYFSVLLNNDGTVSVEATGINTENADEAQKAANDLNITVGGETESDPKNIIKDFSDDKKSSDEELRQLLEDECIESELDKIKEEFDEKILEEDSPLIWDENKKDYIRNEDCFYDPDFYGDRGYFYFDPVTHEQKHIGLCSRYDSEGLLMHEEYYNANGNIEWYKSYNKGILGTYAVYRVDEDGLNVKDVITYYNPGNYNQSEHEDYLEVWGRIQTRWTEVYSHGSLYGRYRGGYFAYYTDGVLSEYRGYDLSGIEQTNCQYDNKGRLSIESIRGNDGLNTVYNYYTSNNPAYGDFEMTGHIQSIICLEKGTLTPKYLRREEWSVVLIDGEYQWKYLNYLDL